MTLRLALRSLITSPVRSAVLACGFGLGIGAMAGLLGIGEVILEQARSPALVGGGDLVIGGAAGRVDSARFVLSSVLGSAPLAQRTAAASPTTSTTLYLMRDGDPLALGVRGGIPSLERALGDPETSQVPAWVDASADRAWTAPDPGDVLRAMDRFHPIPDTTAWDDSWAEWLYFNGKSNGTSFYLSFMVGPRGPSGNRSAGARLQLERDGTITNFINREEVDERALLESAPDLRIGRAEVRLEELTYLISLDLPAEEGEGNARGEIRLTAEPGRSLPPFAVRGTKGWVSGYTVPVLSGSLEGELIVNGERLDLTGGTGYHDHNWGFWKGVTWQWGQVQHEELSLVYGRVRPPEEAADPERLPGFLTALGPDGPLGFSTDVTIEELSTVAGASPDGVVVRARGNALELTLELTIDETVVTRMERAGLDFHQMRATFRVTGRVGDRRLEFTAPGAAETFRGTRPRPEEREADS